MSSSTTKLNLYKANPVADGANTFNIDTILNDNWDKIDAKATSVDNTIASIQNDISNVNIAVPSISYGMNSVIKNTTKTTTTPKFTITGKTIINPFGKDGNCEDVNKWAVANATLSLDSTNKVFGSNGIKITLTSTWGVLMNTLSKYNIDVTKYYLLTAYVKNGNTSGGIYVKKENTGGGTTILGTKITDTTKFTRTGIVVQPSDLNIGNYLDIYLEGASGQYAYVDGIMINEITSAEYALGANALLANYPYVDSYSCLTNPYIEVRHDNLVRNGNGEEGVSWWTLINGSGTLSVENNKFKVIATTLANIYKQSIKLKKNTNYYLYANSSNISLGVCRICSANDTNTILCNQSSYFNTGSNEDFSLIIYVDTGTVYIDSIMLVEGTTAPTSYKTCRLERTVIEGRFPDGDNAIYENGEATGLLNWKHKTLFGKDYDWQYNSDFVGFKAISIISFPTNVDVTNYQLVKYDGKIVPKFVSWSSGDLVQLNGSTTISLSDTDTGWTEVIAPNNDESKLPMNGWKAIYNNGTRYLVWVSMVDGSVPSGAIQSSVSATTNTTAITVTSNGTAFVSGDIVAVITPTGTLRGTGTVTGSPTATNIPLTGSLSVVSGDIVVKADNGSTNTSLLTWCKNNIAPNYEGYQLHYKLANPEPITDANTHVHGDIPLLDVGDNYLYLDSGMVLGEVSNPNTDATNYYINSSLSLLKNKVEVINTVYKNNINDTKWSYVINPYFYRGNGLEQTLVSNFDINATYTVDYKILATQAPQIGSIACSYGQDIVSAINKLEEVANNKQTHDSFLDTLVDLSLYEKIDYTNYDKWSGVNWIAIGSLSYVQIEISYLTKRAIPTITLNNCFLRVTSTGVKLASANLYRIDTQKNNVRLTYIISDANETTNIKTYGVGFNGTLIADCRGKI